MRNPFFFLCTFWILGKFRNDPSRIEKLFTFLAKNKLFRFGRSDLPLLEGMGLSLNKVRDFLKFKCYEDGFCHIWLNIINNWDTANTFCDICEKLLKFVTKLNILWMNLKTNIITVGTYQIIALINNIKFVWHMWDKPSWHRSHIKWKCVSQS